ncbi:hypothetical protein ACFYKX_03625 [Cytobacillus sp. FJAT-54145]|uniref:Lipoprotein n=1 Tax=Cytobacillus spartinae TaxID=3299023 RepID=A0ABW6K690_9BACI
MKFKLVVSFLFLFSIVGCSQTSDKLVIERPLKIAVVGTEPSYNFENIKWVNINIDELFENKGNYNALFVMEETFFETSKPKYASLYKELPYPTFFIGLNEPYELFIDENLTISDYKESESVAFAQGYFNSVQGTKTWKFVPHNQLKSESDYRLIYQEIFNTIIEFSS